MSKIKVKNKKQKLTKFFIISIIVLFILLFIVWFSLRYIEVQNKEITIDNMNTVESVLKYYNCKLVSEKNIAVDLYSREIELVFRYDLYTDEKSNESFYNNLIKDMARVLEYRCFILNDSEKDINIKVICKDKQITQVLINDIEDYYIYMDSKMELSKFIEIKEKSFQIESAEIQNLLANNWDKNTNFGTKESIFESYNEYFDEGIKSRIIDGRIYNVIFTDKYQKNVVNGIYPGMNIDIVQSRLGEPDFIDETLKIIGYKGKDIYVFFGEKEISIYRNEKTDNNDFIDILSDLLEDNMDLLDFMNELTYIWPDYSDYTYDSTSFFISYPLKGVDIKVGYDEDDGVIFYNNINLSKEMIEKCAEYTDIVLKLKIDGVFEAEKRRKENLIEMNNAIEKENSTLQYNVYLEKDSNNEIISLKIISIDGNMPNREINDRIDSYLWINENVLIFSQKQKGIFYFEANTGEKGILKEGKEDFELKKFENGVLTYDDNTVFIEY